MLPVKAILSYCYRVHGKNQSEKAEVEFEYGLIKSRKAVNKTNLLNIVPVCNVLITENRPPTLGIGE